MIRKDRGMKPAPAVPWLRGCAICLLTAMASTALPARSAEGDADGRTLVEQAIRFRTLVQRGDMDAARAMMAHGARRWWDRREGPGQPWTLDAASPGPWAGWDRHFRSKKVLAGWQASASSATAHIVERNDYYRLLERDAPTNRVTYFFDGEGRIEGLLIGGAGPRDPGRTEEFLSWARAHEPAEIAALMPGGQIDPAGDHPIRFRRLLGRWRQATGRDPID